jgi:predicted nucleotidyltransferase
MGFDPRAVVTLVVVTTATEPHSARKLVEQHRDEIRAAARACRASRVRLFGSAARGEDGPGSDVDLLVDFEPGSSLFDLLHLARQLEGVLGRRVDVVSAGGLKPRDSHILDEAVDV